MEASNGLGAATKRQKKDRRKPSKIQLFHRDMFLRD